MAGFEARLKTVSRKVRKEGAKNIKNKGLPRGALFNFS